MTARRDEWADDIAACWRCPRLNLPGITGSAPGDGDERSLVMVVGQSVCGPCMATGIPFTGGSGRFIDTALDRAGRRRAGLFVTNVVHCHPPNNRASKDYEKANCAWFLRRELALVQPLLMVGVGDDTHDSLRKECRRALIIGWRRFATLPALPVAGPLVLCLPHPSHVKFWPKDEQEEWIDALAARHPMGIRGPQLRTDDDGRAIGRVTGAHARHVTGASAAMADIGNLA
ncbi:MULTISPECIES: uracil-DNA glycosylase family protein [Mycobacterium avium complex (MAC)]|uniref:Uracil-DNA glycosylase family protein n=1 Tax=Mycobacterium intracellulare subsp. chimaera TaxID=222805 RepID=A0A7U5MPD0_MYCIT|nr:MULTISPECIES: uracil-DNA glycosylase family protein [Mycobacterium avium complex (MAC)]ASL17283.1 uracil-DNA glycosylase superfamily protein [Mycobacterium intracellulare subsp. chimaera]MDM3928164.1 uracil-DNA glycosylase family protein [Mycobacterium intracellulare subsp. chimaera]BCO85915.1 hypothetical protein MINTM011_42500 [Mycobacterium paraintracellulare]